VKDKVVRWRWRR